MNSMHRSLYDCNAFSIWCVWCVWCVCPRWWLHVKILHSNVGAFMIGIRHIVYCHCRECNPPPLLPSSPISSNKNSTIFTCQLVWLTHTKEPNFGIRLWNVALIFVYNFFRWSPKKLKLHALNVPFSQLLNQCATENNKKKTHSTQSQHTASE